MSDVSLRFTVFYEVPSGGTPTAINVQGTPIGDLEPVYQSPEGDIWAQVYEAVEAQVVGGGGAVDSVNGQTGVVILDADDIADGQSYGITTLAQRAKLSSIASNGIAGAALVIGQAGLEIGALLDAAYGSGWRESGGGGGVSDHGALGGLTDDDHPQYFDQARGDARYYTKAAADALLAGKSATGHTHTQAQVDGLPAALDGKLDTDGDIDASQIATGVIAPARLAAGTPTALTFVRGDGQHAQPVYADLAGIPSEFTPETHNHPVAEITNLQNLLDGKASSNHGHAASAITSGQFDAARISEASITQHEAAIDHGALLNRNVGDPHTQYLKKAGDTATGGISVPAPSIGAHAANKDYVDAAVSGVTPLDPVLDRDLTTSPAHSAGARYIIAGLGGDWSGFAIGDIVESNGTDTWTRTQPTNGMQTWIEDESVQVQWTGTDWEIWPQVTDHTTLQNVGTYTHGQIDQHIDDAAKHTRIDDASTANDRAWSASKINTALAGKAASSHQHNASDITAGILSTARLGGGAASAATVLFGNGWRAPVWGDVGDKPTEFQPVAHTHTQGEIVGLPAALAAKMDNGANIAAAQIASGLIAQARLGTGVHDATHFLNGSQAYSQVPWSAIANIPDTFAPDPHTHTTGEVSGLTALVDAAKPRVVDENDLIVAAVLKTLKFAGPGVSIAPDPGDPTKAVVTVAGTGIVAVPVVTNPGYSNFVNDQTINGQLAATITVDGVDRTVELLDTDSWEIVSQPGNNGGTIAMTPQGAWTLTPGSAVTGLATGETFNVTFQVLVRNIFGDPSAPTTITIPCVGAAEAGDLYRVPVRIDRALESGFELLLTDEMFAGANGGDIWTKAQAGGADFYVTNDAAGTQRLPVAIIEWETGNHKIMTRMSTAKTAGSFIYVWLAGAQAEQPAAGAQYGSEEVFADCLRATFDFETDWTGNTTYTRNGVTTVANGPLGMKAANFDGEAGTGVEGLTALASANQRTYEIIQWRNPGAWDYFMMAGSSGPERIYRAGGSGGDIALERSFSGGGATWRWYVNGVTNATSQWVYMGLSVDYAALEDATAVFNDNAISPLSGDPTPSGTPTAYTETPYWGRHGNGSNMFDGRMGLVMVRDAKVSEAWRRARAANFLNPAAVAVAQATEQAADPGFGAPGLAPVEPPYDASLSGSPIASEFAATQSAMMAFFPANMDGSPKAEVTHYTVQSGAWSAGSTWNTGTVPGAGDVALIRRPHAVTIDAPGIGSAGNFVKKIGVEGTLTADNAATLKCYVDTLLGNGRGILNIGSEGTPFAGDFEWHFPQGQINVAEDPRLLGRGIMWMGRVNIFGAAKTPYVKSTTAGAAQGATTITLDANIPADWNTGDRIAISAVDYVVPATGFTTSTTNPGNHTEYKTIDGSSSGTTLALNSALAYPHVVTGDTGAGAGSEAPPADAMKLRILNMERNIRFISPEAAQVWERGYFMCMWTDQVKIKRAGFYSMGRTDKRVPAFDLDELVDPVAYNSNIKGRYALHYHVGGIMRGPIETEGCFFYDMLGIGVVNHSSYEHNLNNCSAKSWGAHWMAEAGDEKGWIDGWVALDLRNDYNDYTFKNQSDSDRHDWGRGCFFHFESREIRAANLFAAGGSLGAGFVWQTRGSKRHNAFAGNWGEDAQDPTPREAARHRFYAASWPPVIFDRYGYRESNNVHPLNISNLIGLGLLRHSIVIKDANIAGHMFPTHLDGFTGINVVAGIHTEYTAHYVFTNHWYRCHDETVSGGLEEIGMDISQEAMSQALIDPYVEGFTRGVNISGALATNFIDPLEAWHINVLDGTYVACGTNILNQSSIPLDQNNLLIQTSGQLQAVTPSLTLNELTYTNGSGNSLLIKGTRTDECGTTTWPPAKEARPGFGMGKNAVIGCLRERGYWLEQGTDRWFCEFDEHFFSRATGTAYMQKVRCYLSLRPDGVSGSDLGSGYTFNGTKA